MIDSTQLLRRPPIGAGRPWASVRRPFIPVAVLALSAALLAAPGDAMSQERSTDPVAITGRVVDALSGDPIAGVQVVVRGSGAGSAGELRAETDTEGDFQLPAIRLGEYRLELSHPDYNPAVGEFTVMRPGGFVTSMKPLGGGSDELMTGIIGLVRDRNSGSLLSGVHVSMGGGRQGVLSDLRGEFVLDRLIGGQHVVEFSMIGYTPRADTIRVSPGRVTTVEVSLSVDPVQLDPIEVSVERREIILQERGFYHRQKTGFGKFIDREEIEMRGPSEMTDLFSGLAGVELYSDPLNQLERWIVLRSGRHMTLQPRTLAADDPGPGAPTDIYERCFPRIYVDGIVAHSGGDEPARLDTFVDPGVVAGVEVYASVSGLPPEYQGHGTFCGTILIWTRR